MALSFETELVQLEISQLNENDERFCCTCILDQETLESSIQKEGLINPVKIIIRNASFILVDGFKRLAIIKKLGIENFQALQIKESSSDLDIINSTIEEKNVSDIFPYLDRIQTLKNLSKILDEQTDDFQIFKKSFGFYDIPSKDLWGILDMGKGVQNLIGLNKLSIRNACFLLHYKEEDRTAILNVFNQMEFSKRRIEEIVEWLLDLSRNEGKSIHDILNEKAILEILDNPNLNPPQKIQAFSDRLYARRYPEISHYLKNYAEYRRSLKLPDKVRLEASKILENTEHKLELTFKNEKELAQKLEGLDKLSREANFKNLFSL